MPLERKTVAVVQDESLSKLDLVEFHHTWNIPNFSWYTEPLTSTAFSVKSYNELVWKLKVNPCVQRGPFKGFVSVHLVKLGCKNGASHRLEVSILKGDCSKCCTKVACWGSYGTDKAKGIDDFIERRVLLDKDGELLRGDKLTLACKLSVVMFTGNISKGDDDVQMPECRLADDLGRLFESEAGSDVTLTTGGAAFHVHKAILLARSPVFAAMFESDPKEDHVMIPNLADEALREMLRFMYTGQTPRKDKMTGELLVAADKYKLRRLKVMCEGALSSTVSVETAAELLSLSDRHAAGRLKARTMEFIGEHATAVMLTSAWKAMVERHPQLLGEVIEAITDPIKRLRAS